MKIIIVQSHQQSKPPSDWKRPKGRPSHTWLRAIEADLKPLVCMKEGNQLGDLVISGGHGKAQEEYAMRREKEEEAIMIRGWGGNTRGRFGLPFTTLELQLTAGLCPLKRR